MQRHGAFDGFWEFRQKERKNILDIKNLLYSAPPRITARIIAVVLALILAFASAKIMLTIEREAPSDTTEGEKPSESTEPVIGEDESENQLITEGAASIGTVIGARSAIFLDLDSGKVIAQKDMDASVQMKDAAVFMVALTVSKAIKEGRVALSDIAVCPASAAASPSYSLSSHILSIGKKMQLENILKCMFYQSGSSYAYTLAVHTSGSAEAFTDEMNSYAKELGITDTVFNDCTGELSGNSTVSAYDFAVIMKYFLSDTHLRDVFCSNDIVTLGYGAGSGVELIVRNEFFESYCTESQAKSDGIIGGKISKLDYLNWGCTVFNKDGKSYVCAVFDSTEVYTDMLMLYCAYALCV